MKKGISGLFDTAGTEFITAGDGLGGTLVLDQTGSAPQLNLAAPHMALLSRPIAARGGEVRAISAPCAGPTIPSSLRERFRPGAARPRSLQTTRPRRREARRLLP
jgi:hypothetical protein